MLSNPINTRHSAVSAAVALSLWALPAANADIIWTEQINGDFSGNRLAPTTLALAEGNNAISARIEPISQAGELDLDYFSVTVPSGFRLTEVLLENYLSTDFVAFIAIDPHATFTIAPEDASIENLFGWLHFGAADVGQDILTRMGQNGTGFATPLPSGTYTFWAQQIGDLTEYTPVFVVEAIPAPGSLSVLAAAGLLSLRRRRAH
ncbi:MAG: hypothetical protein IT438_06910 [Phycisphaerales bacterium]|nr:hypothetical protein [Phycisphaerales bacterium]